MTNGLRKKSGEETPFTKASNNRKYLGVVVTKQVKDLSDKIFKMLKKDIEEEIRIGKVFPC